MDLSNGQTTDAPPEANTAPEIPANTAAKETEDSKKPGLNGDSDAAKPIKLEIFRSGWTQEGDYPAWGIQGRAFDQSYVQALCDNTGRMMKEAGLKVPIVLNHPTGWLGDEQREAAEGWVLSLECMELEDKDPFGRPEMALVAECIMEGQLKDDYEAGRLPKRSIGWCSEGRLPNGRLMGPYLQHLGLLGGRSQPAIPALQDLPLSASVHVPPGYQGALYDPAAWQAQHTARVQAPPAKSNALQKFAESMKAFMTGVGQKLTALTGKLTAQKTAQTETAMTIEEIKEGLAGVAEYYSAGMAALEELMAGLESEEEIEDPGDDMPEEEPEATEEEPKEEEPEASAKGKAQSKVKTQRLTPSEIKLQQQLEAKERENQKLKQAQAESRFSELARDGKVNASAKEKFLKVAAENGVATAEEYFSHEPAQKQVPGRTLGTPATGQATPAEVEAIKNRAQQIANEYGTSTAMYKSEKARALAIDKGLETFFAALEAPVAEIKTAGQAQ